MPEQAGGVMFKGIGQESGGCDVFVIDERGKRALDERLDEVNHSPDGFQWGYRGSGPAQLAFAILDELYDTETAYEHYQHFKDDFVASLDGGTDFRLDAGEVEQWMETHG